MKITTRIRRTRHHLAKLSDREVQLVRQLRRGGMSYEEIAARFEVSESYVQKLCLYKRRELVP